MGTVLDIPLNASNSLSSSSDIACMLPTRPTNGSSSGLHTVPSAGSVPSSRYALTTLAVYTHGALSDVCPHEFCTSSPAPPYRLLTASAPRGGHTESNFDCTIRVKGDVFCAACVPV